MSHTQKSEQPLVVCKACDGRGLDCPDCDGHGTVLVACPFCGEDDFDLVGLKYHLGRYCTAYADTETAQQEYERLIKERRDS